MLFPTKTSLFAQRRLDQILDGAFREMSTPAVWQSTLSKNRLASSIEETDTEYTVLIAVPGHTSKSVKIDLNLEMNRIDIVAKSEDSSNSKIAADYELMYSLPENADPEQTSAEVKDGILTLTIKKVIKTAKSIQVKVK